MPDPGRIAGQAIVGMGGKGGDAKQGGKKQFHFKVSGQGGIHRAPVTAPDPIAVSGASDARQTRRPPSAINTPATVIIARPSVVAASGHCPHRITAQTVANTISVFSATATTAASAIW